MLYRYACSLFLLVAATTAAFGQINCPPNLPLTLNGNLEYCVGTPGSELNIAQTYDEYLWIPGQENTQAVLLTAGNYEVIVTHYTGCQDTLEFEVSQVSNPPQPTITANGPTQFCHGESVLLTGTEGYPFYTWNSGSVTSELTVFETGTYVMSIADWNGCESSSNSITVTVDPLPVAAFSPNLNGFEIDFSNLSVDATGFEWNFGDGTSSSDFEPTHTYTSEGLHNMWLVASNSCGSDTAFYSDLNVGINESEIISNYKIYPNPATDQIHLELLTTEGLDLVVAIRNCLGQKLLESNLIATLGSNTFIFEINQLPSGYYLVDLQTQKLSITESLIISR